VVLSSLSRDGRLTPKQTTLEDILFVSSECRAMFLELGLGGRRANYMRRIERVYWVGKDLDNLPG
jgi:hypothetical protein